MNMEDLKKTNEELQKEIIKNNKQIAINEEKIRIAKHNKNGNKLLMTALYSTIPFCVLFVLIAKLYLNGVITNIIPVESLPLIITSSSLCIGTIGRKICEQKDKIKEKFKSFSTATTQYEIIKEETKCAIELEKAKNRNKAIQETMNFLQKIVNYSSVRYYINDKSFSQDIDKEDSKKIVDIISKDLNEKHIELDELTTQKVLQEKFLKVRIKGQALTDIMLASLVLGTTSILSAGTLFLIIGSTFSSLSSSNLLTFVLAPFIAETAGVSWYIRNNYKDYRKAFNNLNKDLKENALPIIETTNERKMIDTRTKKIIEDISFAETHLQEYKRIMESFNVKTSVSSKPSIEKENTFLKCDQEGLTEPTVSQQQGHLRVLKRTPNKNNNIKP